MRLVLDTNVLLAAFLTRGACHELLEHCVREHDLIVSDFLLGEVEDKLTEKFRVPVGQVRRAVELLRGQMEVVQPVRLPERVCRDPDDDCILATAIAGRCHCLISGDQDLLVVGEHAGIRIVAPSAFWALESK